MSTEIDLKALWNRQAPAGMPAIKELLAKTDSIKKKTRNKLIGLNLLMLATVVYIVFIGCHIDHVQPTTIIGIALVAAGIVIYMVAYNQMIPLLFKTDPQSSIQEHLVQLLRIKRKHEFLNKVMINIYFVFLSAGIALYMIQFAARMTTFWAITTYAITFAWIAFSWLYLRPKNLRKQLKPLYDTIARLEELNGQLSNE